ncbi:MAG TPA: hypothetical protein VF897_08845, partial [Roseiflexaceae bacterium]
MANIQHLKIVFLASVLLGLSIPAGARAEPAEPLRVITQADGVHLEWRSAPGSFSTLNAQFSIPTIEIGGLRLPAWLIALSLADQAPVAPRIDALESAPMAGALSSAGAPILRPPGGDRRLALALPAAPTLPDSPIVVLRDGRLRGRRVVVLAVSPIFAVGSTARVATHLDATIPGATVFNQDAAQSFATTAPFLASAPGPTNPAAALPSVKVRVTQPGIQRVTGAALAAVGVNLATLDPALIHLRRGGAELALEVRVGADGKLDS